MGIQPPIYKKGQVYHDDLDVDERKKQIYQDQESIQQTAVTTPILADEELEMSKRAFEKHDVIANLRAEAKAQAKAMKEEIKVAEDDFALMRKAIADQFKTYKMDCAVIHTERQILRVNPATGEIMQARAKTQEELEEIPFGKNFIVPINLQVKNG